VGLVVKSIVLGVSLGTLFSGCNVDGGACVGPGATRAMIGAWGWYVGFKLGFSSCKGLVG
jgi:hypothetical protein